MIERKRCVQMYDACENSSHKCKHYFLAYKYYKCHLCHVRLALTKRLIRQVKARRLFLIKGRCKRIYLKAKAYHTFYVLSFCCRKLILLNQSTHFIHKIDSTYIGLEGTIGISSMCQCTRLMI